MLDGLVSREVFLLDDNALSPERGQYRFIQGLLREVAYGRLSRRDRLALHLAAAAHFQAVGGDELAGVVASHYLSAVRSAPEGIDRDDLVTRTISALEVAAARSDAIGAHSSSAAYLADAIDMVSDETSRLGLLEARANALNSAGRYEEAESVARVVIEAAFERGETGRAARCGTTLTQAVIGSGRPALAVAEATAIRSRLGAVADTDPDAIRLTAELARAQLMSG